MAAVVDRLEGDAQRALLRARNGLRFLAGTSRPTLGQTPKDTVWRRDKAQLWRYRGAEPPTVGPPLLIVHSLVSRSYVLDLLPGNSLVEFLLGEGFDVYLLDWGIADAVDAENTLETYVDDALPRAVRAVLSTSGADEVTLAGYCFGGVLTLLLAAGHPELPVRNLLTLATPGDYRHIGLSSRLFGEGRLDADAVIDTTGNVPAAVFDDGFGLLKPTDRLVQYANVWQNLWNDRFMEGYQAMNHWVHDQVPFPGAAFRQTVQMLMRDNALMNGTARLGGRPVDLRAIACPYVNVVAEKDTIVPIEAAEPLSQVVGSGEVEEMRLTTGHVGFVFGRQAAKSTHPRLADWLRRHSDEPAAAGT